MHRARARVYQCARISIHRSWFRLVSLSKRLTGNTPAMVPAGARPKPGDRVLIFKAHWRDLVLRRQKTMEIRCTPLKAGQYWIGCRGTITGRLTLGAALAITDAVTWEALRDQHRVEGAALPYKRTFGLPILRAARTVPHRFKHPRGAIGIVVYRP